MKNVIYFIGLVATLSIIFGCIIHFFGNKYGESVILIGAFITVACLFIIDRLSHKKA
ncbi:MAG: hypothetical protein ACFFKA_12960 [Candidatus Thorarchaeota archaeon]